MDIKILFEDKDVLAIYKPAGLMVHSDGRQEGPFLTDWILEHYPELKEVGEPARTEDGKDIFRPGIVHRLDKETSGVLLIAKNQKMHKILKKQFQDHSIRKTYRLFVYGVINEDGGLINRPIGRSKSDFRRWTAQRGVRGEAREAVTEFVVLARKNDGTGIDQRFSYVEAMPRTGRTHQIRVHFKAINYPIICDKLYAPNHAPALGFERVALHSYSIEFKNREGEMVKITAPLPEDFLNAEKLFDLKRGKKK